MKIQLIIALLLIASCSIAQPNVVYKTINFRNAPAEASIPFGAGTIFYNPTLNRFRVNENGTLKNMLRDWGDIEGTLANQTDLQTVLDGKWSTSGTTNLTNSAIINSDGGSFQNLTIRNTGGTTTNQVLFDLGGLTLSALDVAVGPTMIFNSSTGITITDNTLTPRGIRGAADYSANYQANDYVQKVYTDATFVQGSASDFWRTSGASTLTGDAFIVNSDGSSSNLLLQLNNPSGFSSRNQISATSSSSFASIEATGTNTSPFVSISCEHTSVNETSVFLQPNLVRLRRQDIAANEFQDITFSSTGVSLNDEIAQTGLVGNADYSANYNDLTYVQKAFTLRELGASTQTTDATETSCGTLTLADNSVASFEARVIARNGNTNRASYNIEALVYRNATTTIIENQDAAVVESTGATAWNVVLDVAGTDVRIRVTGAAATTIDWVSEFTEVVRSN